jgi:hypothetical protein
MEKVSEQGTTYINGRALDYRGSELTSTAYHYATINQSEAFDISD